MFRILVIKLGALGDFVQAFGPFASIRAAYPHAGITLLTTAPFRALGEASPWFDNVVIDARPSWLDLRGVMNLRRQLRGYDLVVDLQTSGRSSRYFRLAGQKNWSGIAKSCGLPHDNPHRNDMHTLARQRDQLRRAGITPLERVDLSWLRQKTATIAGAYAVLVPGAAPHRPEKRWPVSRFATIARTLSERGLCPVVVGSEHDRDLAAVITQACPGAVDLTGRTSLMDLAGILARAQVAIGNDTGPMHLAAAMGCRVISLFSDASDPRLTAPVGTGKGQVHVLAMPDLAKLQADRVAALLD